MIIQTCVVYNCRKPPVDKGRCELHMVAPFNGGSRAYRLPADWNTRRNIVLRRDSNEEGIPVCYICGQPGADGVDHVDRGDDHSMENLRAIHHNQEPFCHRSKTAWEGNQARNFEKRFSNQFTPPPF